MEYFFLGFEKQAKMTAAQREKYEQELDSFNRKGLKPGKLIGGGAALGGASGAFIGGASGAMGGLFGGGPKAMVREGIRGALKGGAIGGAAGGTLGGASYAYQKNRGRGYLKNVSDKNLAQSVKASRKYTAGDTKAMNRNYWKQQIDAAQNPRDRAVFEHMLAQEK